MNENQVSRWSSQNPVLTVLAATGLVLLILTMVMIMRSDPAHVSSTFAYISTREAIVVLHIDPEEESGIATILDQGDRVLVEAYHPGQDPSWAFVSRGERSGWIQLIHLRRDPPP